MASNTRTISRNAFWAGVESAFSLLSVFLTTVAVARFIGKDKVGQERLGYYNYVAWLTIISIALGQVGLPATARKYMAEYLNRGEPGVARAAYLSTLKMQSYIVLGILAIATAALLWLGKDGFLVASILLILGMAPRMIASVPSMANNAAETMRRNTGPSVTGGIVTTTLTIACLFLAHRYVVSAPGIAAHNWDLAGLAAAVLIGSLIECALKLRSVEHWLGSIPPVPLDPGLKKRMFAYSSQGMVLLALTILVWDRSDIMILQWLNPDERQVLFFSTAFSIAGENPDDP